MKTAASYIKKKYDCYKDYSKKQIRDVCHIWCEVIEEAQNDVKKEYEEKLSKLNMNDYITIYPNENGFRKIKALIANRYLLSNEEAEEWVKKRTTKENGYKDQMWVIISDLHDMFFNGQNFMETSHFSFL